ncbi:MAG TPA: HlyD family efflux transporter periplasmic adaptor subunit [Anaeromyxobacter sp.]|nr:HlyD family efflux transporter periplasmic adaptor subunit [Anaeromyxobacter sp.]
MRESKTDRRSAQVDAEAARARKRAQFLATIRQASSQVDVPARTAEPPARTREIETRAERSVVRREATREVTRAPAPAAAAPAASPAPAPAPRLFREEALRNRLAFEEGRGVVRVSPPWTWALLWTVVAALVATLTASFVGHVEVTGRGRGILRPASGVRVLTAQMTGTVVAIGARSGEQVKQGATLLRIESASTKAQLLEADRELDALKTRFAAVSSEEDQHYAEQVENLKARAKRIEEQIASLHGSVQFFDRRLQADLGLLKKGLVSEMAVGESRDALAQANRQLSAAEQTLDQTRQELASLQGRRQDELWSRQQQLAAAQNKRDALAVMMQQSVIEAPEAGTVDAVVVREGEVVQAGQMIGKLVPGESTLHVVSFLAERDRAFVKPGDEAQLELDQLPHAQYGTLRARVVRIGDDLASASEIRDALGDIKVDAPSYRVELDVTDAGAADAAHVKLRTGTLMNVRYTLRRERLATLVLSPLKRWFK